MSEWPVKILVVVSCYLIGGIPFGLIIAWLKGVDIRQAGSKNIGATNVARVLGKPLGVAVFLLDFCKGLIPTALVGWLIKYGVSNLSAQEYCLWLFAAFCCILGHICSPYLGFKGGKGVATAVGATMGIFPYLTWAGVACLVVWLLVTWITRYVSVGSLAAAFAFPIAIFVAMRQTLDLHQHWPVLVYALLLPCMVIFKHRGNIARLMEGTETRIGR